VLPQTRPQLIAKTETAIADAARGAGQPLGEVEEAPHSIAGVSRRSIG
jgi:hypothetical protein